MRFLEKTFTTLGFCIFVLGTLACIGSTLQRFIFSSALLNIGIIIFGVAIWTLGKWINPHSSKEIPAGAALCFLFGLPCLAFSGVDFEILDPKITFSLLTVSAIFSLIFGIFVLKQLSSKKLKPAGITFAYAGLTHSGIFVLAALLLLLAFLMLSITHKKSLLH